MLETLVVRLYQTVLARNPTQTELRLAFNRIKSCNSLHCVAEDLIASDEFAKLDNPDNPITTALKSPDNDSLACLVRQHSTRADLLVALAGSEHMRNRVFLPPALADDASPDNVDAYRLWIKLYERSDLDDAQRQQAENGRVVFMMRAGDSTIEAAVSTAVSLRTQSYSNWSVALFTSGMLSPWTRGAVDTLCTEDARFVCRPSPRAISALELIQTALQVTNADYIAELSPGDRLSPSALSLIIAEFVKHDSLRACYTDEDVVDEKGRHSPRFKSAFSPDMAMFQHGVGGLTVLKADLAEEAAQSAASDPNANVTLAALLSVEPACIGHLPSVLLHRSEPYRSMSIKSRPRPTIASPPKVSVLIPTRDQAAFLSTCLKGLLTETAYTHLEVIIIDNGSTASDALVLLDTVQQDERVRVLSEPGAFNFAALNNRAAQEATGEVILLLNNDIEVIQADWLSAMVGLAIRRDVGVVGAKLLYPNRTIQHAGIVLNRDGSAVHLGRGGDGDSSGYLDQYSCTRDVSAVTGACLAIRKSVFEFVGGMNERLAVTWNDVDLCLRIRSKGLRVVWTPEAELVHHEGISRGADASDQAKRRRFLEEQATMRLIWGNALGHDPFLSPNLRALENGRLVLTSPPSSSAHQEAGQS